MRTNMLNDLDRLRRIIHEAESMFGLAQSLVDEDDCLTSTELQDGLDEMIDAVIEFRCALESAVYEGLDHFDQEV